MTDLNLFVGEDWRTLANELLHTFWQGAVIALLLAGLLKSLASQHGRLRYACLLLAMIAVLVTGFST
jgi:hypothetical protein